jgi:hypothetical protein
MYDELSTTPFKNKGPVLSFLSLVGRGVGSSRFAVIRISVLVMEGRERFWKIKKLEIVGTGNGFG